jgi:nitrite reductase (cytochrome c-552)
MFFISSAFAGGVISNNSKWAEDYPDQFDEWKETSKSDKIIDMLEQKPQLVILWAGYGFAKDYNAPRGHFYALQSNQNTLRTGAPVDDKTGPMPTACWTCKSPDVVRMIDLDGENEYFTGKWAKYGDEIANSIGCADCHDSGTADLTLTRDYSKRAFKEIGYDTNKLGDKDLQSMVCAQCHSEYYFKATEWTDAKGNKKTAKVVTFPWANGTSAEEMEKYYDDRDFKDWTHKISKAPMLKAQHPGYEIFTTGIHFKNGVTCADCHMPGGTHHVGSPMEDMGETCLKCHDTEASVLKEVIESKLARKEELMEIAMNNIGKAHLEAGKAWEVGATEAEMAEILQDIRHAQWRWDYSIASHGSFFHAPEETLRLLGNASNLAQEARLKLTKVLARHGAADFVAPDFSTKEKAQKLAGVPLDKLVKEKEAFRSGLLKDWEKAAIKAGNLDPKIKKGMSNNTSYSK